MKVRKGFLGGQYKPLTDERIQRIHATSLRVFAEIGVEMSSSEARGLFRHAGAEVDEISRVIKIAPDLVAELVDRAPSVVNLYGRAEKGEFDCRL